MAGVGGGCAPGAVDSGCFEIRFGGRGCWVSGTWVFLEWFFGLGFGFGLGGVENNVFDVLNALSATGTGDKVFGIWVVDIFKGFGLALQ